MVSFDERLYYDTETASFIVENPRSTDRIRSKAATFQDLYSVGTRKVEVILTGIFKDMNEGEPYNLRYEDNVRYVGEDFKKGILAWWPNGTVRVMRAMAHYPQKIYYRLAPPERELHEHWSGHGPVIYRALANDCKVCGKEWSGLGWVEEPETTK
jgi:hypothetical protein